jgi:hypothetical protein
MSSYLKEDFFADSLPFITYKIILLLILVSVRLLKVTRREVPFSIICWERLSAGRQAMPRQKCGALSIPASDARTPTLV